MRSDVAAFFSRVCLLCAEITKATTTENGLLRIRKNLTIKNRRRLTAGRWAQVTFMELIAIEYR